MAYDPNVNYRAVARRKALKYGLDPNIFARQIGVESIGYDPGVISGRTNSPAGAQGIAQFMPETARGLGINPLKPRVALDAAAKLMAGYVKQYGSYEAALRAYNAGPGAIQASHGYAETNNYVNKILHGQDPGGLGQPRRPGTNNNGRPPRVIPGRPPQAAGLGGLAVSPPDLSALSQLMGQPQQAPVATPIQAPEFSASRYLPSNGMPVQSRQPVQQDDQMAAALAAIGQVQGGLSPMASAASAGTPTKVIPGGPTRGRTLVIGDSLEVGTFPLLKQKLGDSVRGIKVGGKSSSWGIEQLRREFKQGRYDNVVFDMGTNDATVGELRQSLRQLTKIAGGAKVFVSTVNSPFDEGEKNALLRTYARKHPNVELIRWHKESQGEPLSDGIHGGYDKRANLIAGALGYDPRAGQPAPKTAGRVTVLAGANRPGVGVQPVVKSFLSAVAGFLGRPVTVSTGTNHTQYVKGRPGVESDHWSGHGADLGSVSNGFAVGGSGGDRLAAAAIRAATGWSQKRALAVAKAGGIHNFTPTSGPWKGQRIQIIWRAPDHFDHVHVGVL